MNKYLLIESRDAFDSTDADTWCEVAVQLKDAGHDVALFLVQNAVLQARAKAAGSRLGRMRAAGIDVYADEFSLRERGIATDRLAEGVAPAPIDVVIDQLCDSCKVIWH